eukprot:scaffold143092_cov81-Phaeocystis_antarctica.AAC.1
MQRRPGGALWQAQSNQRCSHPRGMSAAISPRLLWAGGCSWAYQRARRDAALSGGALEHWGAGALGRWGAGRLAGWLRRSKRAARAGRLCTGWSTGGRAAARSSPPLAR